jgi:hypothetical protein
MHWLRVGVALVTGMAIPEVDAGDVPQPANNIIAVAIHMSRTFLAFGESQEGPAGIILRRLEASIGITSGAYHLPIGAPVFSDNLCTEPLAFVYANTVGLVSVVTA